MTSAPEPRRSTRTASAKIRAERAELPVPSLEKFPAEIKLEILRNVLISSDKLSFCPLKLSKTEAAELAKQKKWARRIVFSKTLRLARLDQCQFDEPVARALMEAFSALCLVSKSMRLMAREIFFSSNEWVLHTTRTFDAVGWVATHWGPDALSMMRDVRIDIQGVFELGFNALNTFVKAANEGRNLRTLSVRWLEKSRPLQCARFPGASWHYHPQCRDYGLERNRLRGRGLIIPKGKEDDYDEDYRETTYYGPGSEPLDWVEEEVVLLPLKDLRGLVDARIGGTVREKWAVYLEECMTSSVGDVMTEFELDDRGKKAIEALISGDSK